MAVPQNDRRNDERRSEPGDEMPSGLPWELIAGILSAAMDRAPEERGRYVSEVCAGSPKLQEEVESLLAAHVQGAEFLEKPATGALLASGREGLQIGPWLLGSKIAEGGMG